MRDASRQNVIVPGTAVIERANVVPAGLAGQWYVAHTKARNEKALTEDLTRMGIPCYLPLVQRETRSRRTRRISRSTVPVFSGYVFFNATPEQRYQSLTTNRIARVLVVPDQERFVAELERIARLIATQKGFLVVHKIGVGDWGRIVSGPLQGLEGVIVRCAARWRLSMNVTILGQSVQVDVDRQDVEKIDPPAWALNART
ncbi:MAG TPA: transcription termination/antitermination NusG family protein [Phycisphaerae bacterium]|nr:transcription termination/antitermination NusG family protein [Phycisphaerae bacterium]HOJ73918.1 transcription termination/antitermination NusG family protein [Phycisphaerae bacterium]HOM50859.1 transcription termination/antitermination NusG family protein [Phycisphaerae bacterium]HON67782.1 transcription termination/antitermination NusG family protein [Phycisphaerae bacterium]HPP25966.1 transcription termination/antitermination NusG family protein [Phycisphaerae bacterium]